MDGSRLVDTEKDIFFAWRGELIFFSLIGLAIALVSLELVPDPAQKDIRERLNILLGGSKVHDSVETFLLSQIGEITPYCTTAHWALVIEEFNANLKAYRVRAETTYEYFNPVRDQGARFDVRFSYKPDPLPGFSDEDEAGRYVSIMVGGDDKLALRGPIPILQKGVSDKLKIEVPPHGKLTVVSSYVVWMAIDREQLIRPNRFVEYFNLAITNRNNIEPKAAPYSLVSPTSHPRSRTSRQASKRSVFG